MIFLLGNLHIFTVIPGTAFLGVTLLGIGVWIFLRKMTETGLPLASDGTPGYQFRLVRALRGAIWLMAIGILWLLDSFNLMSWSDSWPWIVILAGIFMILQRVAYNNAAAAAYVPPVYTPPAPATPESETREGGN
jgi:hypothetical protein